MPDQETQIANYVSGVCVSHLLVNSVNCKILVNVAIVFLG